ncbi:hypothetical protein, conserved [Babesia bigemina]|uniref:Uncharacterized protein n=1 Tax=Babesia bigemina TaxID=5866 RepID=A0A061DE46_BABBI|nr:hypothetical protein, conserved [Babesia bigemina]CDR96810.1 hypothetical protein, conserved [Babesia bigemina]|eukprot:XP_012768996.1 hypothetical protein, conserved [Babesia bigemina]
MVFGSPYSDQYPKGVWDGLKRSRRGKDIFGPLTSALNATRIYNHVLKHSKGYWLFSIAGGCLSCYALGTACDAFWRHVNKGRLYIDLPYKSPESDD